MERKANLDVLRILAALGVVGIHLCGAPVNAAITTPAPSLVSTLNLIHTLLMWSVPIFFLLTGYCLGIKKELSYRYCFSHVLKFVAALFTVGLCYALLERIYNHGFSIKQLGLSFVDVLTGNLWDHMWFVYAIIGIYLILPILHRFVKSDKKDALLFTGILFVGCIVLPSIEYYTGFGIHLPIPVNDSIFYVTFGLLLANYKLERKFYPIAWAVGVVSAILILVFSDTVAQHYNDLCVCLMAVAILLLFDRLSIKPSRFLTILSSCTWGVYLLHPLFINILLKLLKLDLLRTLPAVKLPLAWLLICAVSFGVTFLLKKIPLVKWIF